jgi:hypothetical protein
MRSKFIEDLESDIKKQFSSKLNSKDLDTLNLLCWYYENKFKEEIKKAHFTTPIRNESNFTDYYKSHFLSQE